VTASKDRERVVGTQAEWDRQVEAGRNNTWVHGDHKDVSAYALGQSQGGWNKPSSYGGSVFSSGSSGASSSPALFSSATPAIHHGSGGGYSGGRGGGYAGSYQPKSDSGGGIAALVVIGLIIAGIAGSGGSKHPTQSASTKNSIYMPDFRAFQNAIFAYGRVNTENLNLRECPDRKCPSIAWQAENRIVGMMRQPPIAAPTGWGYVVTETAQGMRTGWMRTQLDNGTVLLAAYSP
jgi:hypothetical protein